MKFEDTPQYKKGLLGEQYLDEILKRKGLVIYKPTEGKAHPFDRLCATDDKKNLYIAEVKTKACRSYYPDTGINLTHYLGYTEIQQKYNMDIYLYFIDENRKEIYGGLLRDISKSKTVINPHNGKPIQYPLKQGVIIYFPLSSMEIVAKIEDSVAEKLQELNTRNYEYEAILEPPF